MQYCARVLTTQAGASEPVVYYSFDELGNEVIDESGNNNNGTPQGGTVLNADGKINACYTSSMAPTATSSSSA